MSPVPDPQPPDAPVGRARDVGTLRRLVEDPGPSGVVLVTGEAGIGKTTLVDHVVAGAVAVGNRVLRGSADEADAARFSLWRRVLRDLGVGPPHADASIAVADQVDELAALVGDAVAAGSWRVLVLEDLQWADDASLRLVALVAERLVGRPVLVLGTVRTGDARSEALARLTAGARVLALRGLSADDIGHLAASTTGEQLRPEDAEALRGRTGGNPLLVRELLAVPGHRPPLAGNDLLTRSIEQLGATPAGVLAVFAVGGRATPIGAIAAACGIGEEEVEVCLARAEQADVLTSGPEGRWFRHDLLATAAGERLDPASRRDVHRALADHWAGARSGDDAGLERARHLLGAVPSVPPDDAAREVLAIAAGLRRRRRAGDAADLLTRALAALAGASRAALAELWTELGEARWDLAEKPAALECFEHALDAVGDLDPPAAARIELARQRYHNPFIPDPEARERLAALDEQVGPGDSPQRAALLGRRALLALQPPARRDEATALADEALAVARRIGDPEALLVALCDRAFVIADADDLRGRGAVAEEVLDLARAARRPDLALAGYEWRCDHRLLVGDLAGARKALEELEALAAVAPSPAWRYAALLRLAEVALVEGDRTGALDAVEATSELAAGRLDRYEQLGLELGVRAPAILLFGLPDPRFEQLQVEFVPAFDRIPSTFIQVRIALGDLLVGEGDAAARRAPRWLDRPAAAFEAPDVLGTLGIMTVLADELQLPGAAAALLEALDPFRGLVCQELQVPTELLLAQLQLLLGAADEGVVLAQHALGRARELPSAVVEAHCLRVLGEAQRALGDVPAADAAKAAAEAIAEGLGAVLDPPWSRRAPTAASAVPEPVPADAGGHPGPTRSARLARAGDVWTVEAGVESGSLPHLTGLSQLARLLAEPGREIPAVALTGNAAVPTADLGPSLDARAKREYRRRIADLQAEIDEADRWADPDRADAARLELDALLGELRRAVGLSGRDRPQGSGSERARVNAARNLRRAITALQKVAPELGAHLAVSVRTGHQCCYAPEPAARVDWEIEP